MYEHFRCHIYVFCLCLRQPENYMRNSKELLKKIKKTSTTIGLLFVPRLTVIQKGIQYENNGFVCHMTLSSTPASNALAKNVL